MPSPPPNSGEPCPKRSWFTIMMPFAARTLCECQPSGILMCWRNFGCFGSETSKSEVPLGLRMCPMSRMLASTHTCPPPGTSMCATCLVLRDFIYLHQARDIALGQAAPFLMQPERAQRRLVAAQEKNDRFAPRLIHMLVPLASRYRE